MRRILDFMKGLSPETKVLLLLLVPIALVILLHFLATGFIIYNDGMGYYVWVRSIVIDKDLNFSNEWSFYNSSYSKFSNEPRGINAPTEITPKGYMGNLYPIGNSVMWAPFFLTAHLASSVLNSLGFPIQADGYNALYEIAIGAASLVYGFLGMLLIYKFCRKWFGRRTSLLATIAIWYGTAVFWYNAIEPSLSHTNSLFLNTLFIYFWHSTLGKRTKIQWLLLGLIAGTIYLVRQQDILIVLLPVFETLKQLLSKIDFHQIRKMIAERVMFGLGLLINLFPQMLIWKKTYGSYLLNTYYYKYYDTGHFEFFRIMENIQNFLTYPSGGMWRMPLLLLSIAGVFLFARKVKGVAWYFLILAAAQIYLTFSWTGWINGYGIRHLIGISPLLALGAAEVIQRLRSVLGTKLTYAALALLIAANFLNMILVLMAQVVTKTPIQEIPAILIGMLR
ncbi:MAG: glycosyltransferase family 39 protein [Nanoarchaeota archaeon]